MCIFCPAWTDGVENKICGVTDIRKRSLLKNATEKDTYVWDVSDKMYENPILSVITYKIAEISL